MILEEWFRRLALLKYPTSGEKHPRCWFWSRQSVTGSDEACLSLTVHKTDSDNYISLPVYYPNRQC